MSGNTMIRGLLMCAAVWASVPACAQDEEFDVRVSPRIYIRKAVPAPGPLVFQMALPDPQGIFVQRAPAPPAPPAPPYGGMPGMNIVIGGSGSFLGVGVRDVDAERAKELKLKEEQGVEVTNVEDESPAEKAGLKKGDVVLEYNGQRVEGTEQFVRFVRETPAGRQVKLSVWRGGAAQTMTATVAKRGSQRRTVREFQWEGMPRPEVWIPDMPRPNMSWRSQMLGVEAESLEGQLAQYFGVKEGVLVRSVMKDSAAEKGGIKAGDVITKVGQEKIDTPRALSQAVRSREKKTQTITLMRDRKEMTVTVTTEQDASSESLRPRPRRVSRPDEQEF